MLKTRIEAILPFCEVSRDAPSVCLRPSWMENPNRLVSLWDIVQPFMACWFNSAVRLVRDVQSGAKEAIHKGLGDYLVGDVERKQTRKKIEYCENQCKAVELQESLGRIAGAIRVGLRDGLTYRTLETEMRVLLETMQSELELRRFAFVPVPKAAIFDKVAHEWRDIWPKFPKSEDDTKAAVECYALDQNTACIFHLMRVSEHGLRALATKLPIKLIHRGKNQPIEFAEWDKIITAINNKLTAARQLSQGPGRTARLKFYSDAADHCLYMKELRNELSHARRSYNPGEALGALQRVHGFMTFLASGCKKGRRRLVKCHPKNHEDEGYGRGRHGASEF